MTQIVNSQNMSQNLQVARLTTFALT